MTSHTYFGTVAEQTPKCSTEMNSEVHCIPFNLFAYQYECPSHPGSYQSGPLTLLTASKGTKLSSSTRIEFQPGLIVSSQLNSHTLHARPQQPGWMGILMRLLGQTKRAHRHELDLRFDFWKWGGTIKWIFTHTEFVYYPVEGDDDERGGKKAIFL